MKTLTFNFYSDGSHGWVKVKKELLAKLEIAEHITNFSYMKGEYAYLEEDQDATTFTDALRNSGVEPKFKEHYSSGEKRSKIRSYDSYVFLTHEQTLRFSMIRSKMYSMGNWGAKGRRQIAKAKNETLEHWNYHYNMGL